MAAHIFGKCAATALVAVLLTGCGIGSPGASGSTSALLRTDDCLRDRRSCIHEGSYEQGERAYAEEQARRLNRAQSVRLRRGF